MSKQYLRKWHFIDHRDITGGKVAYWVLYLPSGAELKIGLTQDNKFRPLGRLLVDFADLEKAKKYVLNKARQRHRDSLKIIETMQAL